MIVISNPPSTLTALGRVSNGGTNTLQDDSNGLAILGIALSAAITLGVTGTAASFGMATTSTAALGAITEKPENFGRSILYVVFIEAIAIYGFVIAFLLIGYIPDLIGT
ncbi:hypothetical protein EU538_01675 [Candidatus Thorarchaeota archaeon]|nr:MAG: hypothetical protein EU538_01675 [Candidatus Thorarchaeota archaeon]